MNKLNYTFSICHPLIFKSSLSAQQLLPLRSTTITVVEQFPRKLKWALTSHFAYSIFLRHYFIFFVYVQCMLMMKLYGQFD